MSEAVRMVRTVNRPARSNWLVLPMLAVYCGAAILLFLYWVQPSLTGENDRHITADSMTYIYFAEALRHGQVDAYTAGSLYTFPNTLWGAVSLAVLLPDTFNEMLFNLVIFGIALWCFSKAVDIDAAFFLLLLALNPTTLISLMAVNKELLDFFALALFMYYLRCRKVLLLVSALLICLISRFETCIAMSMFLFFRSRLNPFLGRRWRSLVAYCLLIDIVIAIVLRAPSMAIRLEEANFTAGYSGGTSLFLTNLEQHFLFIVAVIPKILQSLFGEAFNVPHWYAFSMDDPAGTFMPFGNNIANIVVVSLLIFQRRMTLRSSVMYYAAVLAVTMSISVVVQPRYFYGVYVLLCLEAARRIGGTSMQSFLRSVDAAV